MKGTHRDQGRAAGPDLKALVQGDRPERVRRPWRALAAVVVALAVAGAVVTAARLIRSSAPAADLPLAGRLALLPLVDSTGERSGEWIETGLMEMIAEAVARSAGGAMVSPQRLRSALEPRGLDLRDPAARERARALALAAGADQVLDATLTTGRRDGYVFELELFDATGAVGSSRMQGTSHLAVADALAFSIARGLSSHSEPYRLLSHFSRSPFVDRLYASGVAELYAAGPDAAQPYFEIALRHQPGFVQAKARLMDCAQRLGELERGVEIAGELLREAQSRGDRDLEARSLQRLASLAALQGRLDEASDLYAQAYSMHLDLSDRPAQAATLYETARPPLVGHDSPKAEELYVEMLRIQQELGDRLGEADTLFQIGSLLLAGGDYDGAEQALADSRELSLQTGDVWTEMRVTTSLGEIAQRRGELETAKRLWRRALGFYQQRQENPRRLLLSYKLAQTLVESGELDEAEDRLHDMRELAVELEDRAYEARAALGLAWILLRTSYPKQAKPHLDRALELDRWLDDRKLMQLVIAWYAYEQGNYRLAVDAQSAIQRHTSDSWWPGDEAFLRVFREAEQQGRRLPLPGEAGYVEPAASADP